MVRGRKVRRYLSWAVLAAVGTSGGWHAARTATGERLVELARERDRVVIGLDLAVRNGVQAWAPEAWRLVERQRQPAIERVQAAGAALWWRSVRFEEAEQALARLTRSLEAATTSAQHRQREAEARAREALAAAETILADARRGRRLLTDAGLQRRVSDALVALEQAQQYLRDGRYIEAASRASQTLALAGVAAERASSAAARYADAAQIATWRDWVARTIEWSRTTGRTAVVVVKAEHALTVYERGRAAARIDVDLSANWPWAKVSAGDRGVPEGRYRVSARKDAGATLYHRALLLDYPSQADLLSFRAAKRAGRLPASATIGGLIEVHGEGGRDEDWTDGCIALANRDMDALFARAAVGTPVTIVGATQPVDLLQVLDAREARRGR
jgi:hypothetical protein